MLNEKDSSRILGTFFKKSKIGKLTDLFQLLKTESRMSVFRRLRELRYLTSYTHHGSYYTLQNTPDFDSSGLWHFNDVGFSEFGNLKETVFHFIEHSEYGKTHEELENQLHVRVHNTLLDLVKSKKIARIKIEGNYTYVSIKSSKSNQQILHRKNYFNELKYAGLSDWIIIEILASVIRTNKGIKIDVSEIVKDLSLRGVSITENQVNHVLDKFDLKKTLASS